MTKAVTETIREMSEAMRKNGFGVPTLRFENWADGMAVALAAGYDMKAVREREDGTNVVIYSGVIIEFPARVSIKHKRTA